MFYEKIQEYKKKKKIRTDREFEELCGLRQASCSYWKHRGNPSLQTVHKIAEATKTSVKYWL